MLRIAAIGIVSVLLALQFKGGKQQEFGIYLALMAGFLIFTEVLGQLEYVIRTVTAYVSELKVISPFLSVLYKMIGIAYVSEFASGICKDAGYSALSGQIEMAGKITLISLSMPIILEVLDAIRLSLLS